MGLLPGASAADPTTPSQDDIEAAQRHVETTAEAVGRIKSELVAAEETVRLLELDAQKAVEAYNGAVYELDQSRRALRRAERVSVRARSGVERLHDTIATAVVADSLDGGALADLGVLLQDSDPGALMDQLSSYRGFTGAMENELDKFDAQSIVADVLAEQAQDALVRNAAAAEVMEAARLEAQESLTLAEQAAAGLVARKDELVVELAEAQDISVELARARQQALVERAEEEARLRAEQLAREQAAREERQERRAQALEDAREQAAREERQERRAPALQDAGRQATREKRAREAARADARDEAADEAADRAAVEAADRAADEAAERAADEAAERAADRRLERAQDRREARRQVRRDARREIREQAREERREQRQEQRERSGDDGGAAPSGGVEAAVDFALAQVGDPYVWGAAGPDAWDCSGLTMGAWGAAGVSLPHYSVAQYDALSPVSMSSIRRGDLLFWSDGAPSSIYHVALYLGDGMMVHAPRTGREVEVVSMYYWITPDLAGRT
jgi:cell wall-associated NlpC family hydrolase